MASKTTSNRKHDSQVLADRAMQVQRGGARAAVLGVNDGLVSVLCIVLGVAGANAKASAVLLAGFAGLVAGAISMAAGEWISVTSQVELFDGVLKDLRQLVQRDPELLSERLTEDYQKGGFSPATAKKASQEVSSNEQHLYQEFANNVIGINPDELGSPWTAALSSLALFTAGALAALVPWFFTSGTLAVLLSVIFTALGGLSVGAYVARSSGNAVWKGAIRQLAIIILASVVTYGIGHVFGSVTGV